MVQILEEVPSFGTQLARGLGAGVGSGLSQAADFYQKMMLEKQKSHSLAQQTKHLEKVKLMEDGLDTIKKMKELSGYAGGWSSAPFVKAESLLPGETQKKRAELVSLGMSLIPLRAAGVSIRNQREFDKYSHIITDPDSSPSQLEGALDGLQSILEHSLENVGSEEEETKGKIKKVKFSKTNPEHRKKAQQLFETHKDKKKVREDLSREFEF